MSLVHVPFPPSLRLHPVNPPPHTQENVTHLWALLQLERLLVDVHALVRQDHVVLALAPQRVPVQVPCLSCFMCYIRVSVCIHAQALARGQIVLFWLDVRMCAFECTCASLRVGRVVYTHACTHLALPPYRAHTHTHHVQTHVCTPPTVRQRVRVLPVTRRGELHPAEARLRRDDLHEVAHGALHAHGDGAGPHGAGARDDAGDLLWLSWMVDG